MRRLVIAIIVLALLIGGEIIVFVNFPIIKEKVNTEITRIAGEGPVIRSISPKANSSVSSPLTVSGSAPGEWFFEGSFPILVLNWDGLIIGEGQAKANPPAGGDWMTTDYVSFEATVSFGLPQTPIPGSFNERGTLLFKRDNPSGLPENDASYEMPIIFKAD